MPHGTQPLDDSFRVKPFACLDALQLEYLRQHDFVRQHQTLNQLALENIAAKCVRARLKDRPKFLSRIHRSQGLQRLAYSRRMMCKVVDNRYSIYDCANFQPALHAGECLERESNRIDIDPLSRSQCCSSTGIQRIVLACHTERELSPRFAGAQQLPIRTAVALSQIGETPHRARLESIAL